MKKLFLLFFCCVSLSISAQEFSPDSTFILTETGAQVNTVGGLVNALAYDYGFTDITIELLDCIDSTGVYELGNTAKDFPRNSGNLIIKAADGAKPQLWGSFLSNGMKLNSITFEGLSWNGGDSSLSAYNDANFEPFKFRSVADTVLQAYTIKNCRFLNFDNSRILRAEGTAAGLVIKQLVFEGCEFDNIGWNKAPGVHGPTFIQIDKTNAYEFDNFVFTNNVVRNFHGNQLFNIPRAGTTAAAVVTNFRITIENNTFYKLGGNGTSDRNFLEYNQTLGGLNAVININNNLFFDRWDNDNFPVSKIALFNPVSTAQSVKINLQNNLFYPDNVLSLKGKDTLNLLVVSDSIKANRKDFFMSDFVDMPALDLENKLSYKLPIYSAGLLGSPIGALQSYYVPAFDEKESGAVVSSAAELIEALSYNDYASEDITIELLDCIDEGGIYLIGTGTAFPQTFGNVIIKAAEGAQPLIWGSFSSNNGMKVNNITFEGLHWNGADSTLPGFNSEAYQPFGVLRADTVLGSYTVQSCTFRNLDYQRIFRSNACAGAVVKQVVFEHNLFDNMGWNRPAGTHGQSFIQMVNSNNYEMDHFIFRENEVKNFHGNQFFNMPRTGTTADTADVNFTITVENNTFYKFGGQGGSDRNFLEYNKELGGLNGLININNNLFYERWSYEKFPQCKLTLFEPAEGQNLTVNVLNNFYYPDNVVSKDPVYTPDDTTYFGNLDIFDVDLATSKIVYNSNDLFMSSFPEMGLLDPENKLSYKLPLFTAGTEGTYIGTVHSYYVPAFIEQPTGAIVKNSAEFLEAMAYTDYTSADITIEMLNSTDENGLYMIGAGTAFPQTFGNLTIKAAEGAEPKVFGRLSSNNGMKAQTFLVEGLTFDYGDSTLSFNSQNYNPFHIKNVADSVMVSFTVRNCNFMNMHSQLVMRTEKCTNAVIKQLLFENCYFDNHGWTRGSGEQFGHFFQFDKANTYEMDNFIFRNNIVKNFHGSQTFNIGRTGTTAEDPNFSVSIENNTFYKFGGSGSSARQFLGYGENLGGNNAVININNNLFYDRWSTSHFPHALVTLFEPDSAQTVTLNILNNFFSPDTVVAAKGGSENLPVVNSSIVPNRKDLFMFMPEFSGMGKVFQDEALLTIAFTSPLYTAGTNGTFVGAEQCYVEEIVIHMLEDFPYETGKLSTNSSFELPLWMSGEGYNYTYKSADFTTREAFATALGTTADAGGANGIRIAKSVDDIIPTGSNITMYMAECDSIYLTCWGTGGRGMMITNDVTGDTIHSGNNSYTLVEVAAKLGINQPVHVKLSPTGKTRDSYSTGDTYINELKIYKTEPNSVKTPQLRNAVFSTGGVLYVQAVEETTIEVFNILGLRLNTSRAQEGLNVIEGLSAGQMYLIRVGNEIIKLKL